MSSSSSVVDVPVPERTGRSVRLWHVVALVAPFLVVFGFYQVEVRERDLSPSVTTARKAYLEAEGHRQRGELFSNLASALDDRYEYGLLQQILHGGPYRVATVLDVLGPPDLYIGQMKGSCTLAYFYDRFGHRDWVCYVEIWRGRLHGTGWNDASVNDHSQWTPGSQANRR